jgi:signal transduction histidine kinase
MVGYRWRDWPWAVKLGTVLVLLAVVPLAVLTAAGELSARHAGVEESRARNQQRAEATSALLERYLEDLTGDVRILALAPATAFVLRDPDDRARRHELQTLLASMRAAKHLQTLLVLDTEGQVVAATDPAAVGESRISAPHFRSAMAGQTRVHDPRYLPDDRAVHVHVSVPVLDADERAIGVTVARVTLAEIDRLVAGDTSFGGLDEFGLLWDEQGIVISAPARPELGFRPLGGLSGFMRDRLVAEQRFGPRTDSLLAQDGRGDALVEHARWRLYDGSALPHLAVDLGSGLLQVTSMPLPGTRWTYGIAVPQANVLAGARAQSQRLLGVAVLTAALAVALAVVAARRVSRPLKRIGAAARGIARGDLTSRAAVARRDEIGRVAEAFDAMAEALAQKDAELRRHADSLERRVEERTAEVRGLLEAIPDLIFRVSREGRLVDYVAAKNEPLALPPDQFLGRTLLDVMPREVARPAMHAMHQVFAGQPAPPFEYRLTLAGETRHYEARVSAAGPDAVVFVVRNISERRRNEERARFLARAGTTLASSLDLGNTCATLARLAVPFLGDICIVDLLEQGRLRCAAVAATSTELEGPLAAMRARYPVDVSGNHPVAVALRSGAAVFPEAPASSLRAAAQSADHAAMLEDILPESLIVVPLVARGVRVGCMSFGIARSERRFDVADLALAGELAHRAAIAIDNARLYREVQDASRLKDEFLGIVSHELRTPLNAVLGWTQVLRRGKADREQAARALDAIDRNARAQAQLVDDLLDTSRLVSGKLRVRLAPTDLRDVIDRAIESLGQLAQARRIDLEARIAPDLGAIPADASRLQQVIGNVLANALKFTPPGGRVVVSARPAGSCVEIRVTDTGIGISPDFLPYVFDRFRQADSTTTRTHGGLGIGLALARHLVELHGGTIRAESEGEDRGSTFIVTLPAAAVGFEVAVEGELGAGR